MKVVCSYYNNIKRLGLVVDKLSLGRDFSVYPVRGTVVRTPHAVRCVGDVLEFLVLSGTDVLLLTSNPEYAGQNGNLVEYDETLRDNIYVQALSLCKDKFATSINPFQMECSLKGCTVVAAAKKSQELTYTMRTSLGEALTVSSAIPKSLYTQCQGIKAFQYSVVTDTCEKEVVVRKGQVEVFREIAHYINKALIFTRIPVDGGSVREYCITATGCCELREVKFRGETCTKLVKVPFTKFKIDPGCSLSAVDCSLDVLLKSRNISAALRGEDYSAQD